MINFQTKINATINKHLPPKFLKKAAKIPPYFLHGAFARWRRPPWLKIYFLFSFKFTCIFVTLLLLHFRCKTFTIAIFDKWNDAICILLHMRSTAASCVGQ